jgi:hypothetical protein
MPRDLTASDWKERPRNGASGFSFAARISARTTSGAAKMHKARLKMEAEGLKKPPRLKLALLEMAGLVLRGRAAAGMV